MPMSRRFGTCSRCLGAAFTLWLASWTAFAVVWSSGRIRSMPVLIIWGALCALTGLLLLSHLVRVIVLWRKRAASL
jgi:hypothetical protein